MCYCWVHRNWRDGAGLRLPFSCAGSPPSLPVRGGGLGACSARVRFVPSTPSYRRSEAGQEGLIEASWFACRLGYREGYMACRSGSPTIMVQSRRGTSSIASCPFSEVSKSLSLSIRTFLNHMVSIYDVATSGDLPHNCDRTHELVGSYSRHNVEGKAVPCYIAMVSTPQKRSDLKFFA
ncbi:hypothetical protein IW262DRAFT_1417380 [Armillaria fumosa]|nr:hypothetical protein IW262DRAFT_1417380 [Armillaria fumosa]